MNTALFFQKKKRKKEKEWVERVVSQALSIVNFFTKKVKVLAIFREHSQLELKRPASTRFAYMWLLLERLYDPSNDGGLPGVCSMASRGDRD